jgi:uncharacterized membrane protein
LPGGRVLHFSPGGQRWLKGAHLLCACCWIGGAVSLLLLYFLKASVGSGAELFGVNRSIHFVDMAVVVIPGAFGSLLTGLLYSLCTEWGFFKHTWIVVKWVVTILAILFGTFYLGPWETGMMRISGELGLEALQNADYLHNQRMNLLFGALQLGVLIVTLFISIFKPWRRKTTPRHSGS